MIEHLYLLEEDLRIFSVQGTERLGGFAVKDYVGVHIIHMPTGMEVIEKSTSSLHRNKALALDKLNEMVKNSNLRFYVGRTLSKPESATTTFKVYSGGLRTRFDASVLMNACMDKEPNRKNDFFIFHKGV